MKIGHLGARSSNELQWLCYMRGYQDSNLSNGHYFSSLLRSSVVSMGFLSQSLCEIQSIDQVITPLISHLVSQSTTWYSISFIMVNTLYIKLYYMTWWHAVNYVLLCSRWWSRLIPAPTRAERWRNLCTNEAPRGSKHSSANTWRIWEKVGYIGSSHPEFSYPETKNDLHFAHWDGTAIRSASSWKTKTCWFYIHNAMAADVLTLCIAEASSAMLLNIDLVFSE